jgi:Asp-tRNA(Asn)/Glu-tRNA(Gln) amidotransferase A subunit family amidase
MQAEQAQPPLTHRDSFSTHPDLGMSTTAGTKALIGAKVPGNAAIIQQLIDAGAISM